MAQFKTCVYINQSPEITWNAYIDPQNMLKWTRFLEKVEVIDGKFGEVGAIAHLHYLEKGRSYVLEDKLFAYESGRRILSQVSGQGMIFEVDTIFKSHQDGTNISINWKGTSLSIFIRVILKITQRKIAKQARAELFDFKRLVETYGEKFPDKSLKNK